MLLLTTSHDNPDIGDYNMFYVLIQKGLCIFGTGRTKEETLEEVCEWTDTESPSDLDYTESYDSADEDTFVLIECTQRLYKRVAELGSVAYQVDHNIADIYNQ